MREDTGMERVKKHFYSILSEIFWAFVRSYQYVSCQFILE